MASEDTFVEINPGEKIKNICRKECSVRSWRKRFPITYWLPKYRFKHLQCDIIAGLTVGLTVIPQGLAYAQIAELPPQYGLYSAFMGCFVYTFLGTSKDITLGPTAIMSLMTADFGLSPLKGDPTYAIILTLFCGAIQLVMGLLHLGFLVQFISLPVINGFTSAAAITIAFGQLKKLLGLKGVPREFLHQFYETFKKIPETNIWDLVMGLVCMIILVIFKFLKDMKFKDEEGATIPLRTKIARKTLWLVGTARNAIVVLMAAGVAAILENYNVDVLSMTQPLKGGLPSFEVPKFTLDIPSENRTVTTSEIFSGIGSGFIIIPIIGLLETIAIGKAFARQNDYRIDANQELIAVGAANLVSCFVSSYPITGSFSRTAVNSQSGVKTPAGGMFTGALVILSLLLLTEYFRFIPDSALAAVIITAVLQMVDYEILRTLWRVKKLDLLPLLVTFILSFILGIEYGIMIGIGVSVLMLLYPMARPTITQTDKSVEIKRLATINGSKSDMAKNDSATVRREVVIYQPDSGLKFPGVEYMRDKIVNHEVMGETPKSVVFDFTYVSGVDFSTVQMVKQLYEDFKRHKLQLAFTGMRPEVLSVIEAADVKDFCHYKTQDEAVRAIYGQYDEENNEAFGKENGEVHIALPLLGNGLPVKHNESETPL